MTEEFSLPTGLSIKPLKTTLHNSFDINNTETYVKSDLYNKYMKPLLLAKSIKKKTIKMKKTKKNTSEKKTRRKTRRN